MARNRYVQKGSLAQAGQGILGKSHISPTQINVSFVIEIHFLVPVELQFRGKVDKE